MRILYTNDSGLAPSGSRLGRSCIERRCCCCTYISHGTTSMLALHCIGVHSMLTEAGPAARMLPNQRYFSSFPQGSLRGSSFEGLCQVSTPGSRKRQSPDVWLGISSGKSKTNDAQTSSSRVGSLEDMPASTVGSQALVLASKS